jgi:hypothetical protein
VVSWIQAKIQQRKRWLKRERDAKLHEERKKAKKVHKKIDLSLYVCASVGVADEDKRRLHLRGLLGPQDSAQALVHEELLGQLVDYAHL